MAKQLSLKQQMYQQIANSQVQEVMAQQRQQGIQQLQAEFDAWQTRQNGIAQLQAEFDAWNAQNNPQPAPKQSIPSIANAQPQRDLQAEAKEYFANVKKVRREEAAEAKRLEEQQLKATLNDYAKAQQEENMLASMSANKKKELKVGQRPEATDTSAPAAARLNDKSSQRGGEKWNKSVKDTLNMLNSKDMQAINMYQKAANAKKEAEAKAQEIPDKVIQAYADQNGLSFDEAKTVMQKISETANTQIAPAGEVNQELTQAMQANRAEELRKANQKQYTPYESFTGNMSKAVTDVVNGPVYLAGKLTGNNWDLYNDRQREEIANMREQHPTASNVGTMAGMALAAYGAGGGTGGRALAQEGLPTAAEAFNAAQGEALLNGATKGAANLTGLNMAGRQLASNAAKDLIQTDLATDIIPTLANDIAEGKSAKEVALNTALNTGINFGFNSLADIASLAAKPLKNGIDNAVLDAKKSLDRPRAIAKGYDYDYKGVPIEYNDKIVEPENLTYKLTGEQVSPEYAAAVRKLDAGEAISSEEYNAIPEIADAKARASVGEETIKINTPERKQLREKWRQDLNNYGSAEEYFDPVANKMKVRYNGDVKKGHRADIVIGLPSSGKSSAVVDPLSYKYKSKLLDSDEAKKLIDEFNDGWGAGNVHEESKAILEEAKADAFSQGENVVLPIVGHDYSKLKKEINRLKDVYGYKVYVHLNELDPNKAAGRNLRRLANEGRFLDLDSTSFDYANRPSQVFELMKREGLIDGYTRVSNDVKLGDNPVQLEGTEDINFNWRNNGQSGRVSGPDSGKTGSGVLGTAPGSEVTDTAPLIGGNDYGTKVSTGYDGTGSEGVLRGANENGPLGKELRGVEPEGRGQLSSDSVLRTDKLTQNNKVYTDEELNTLKNNGVDTPNFYNTNDDPQLFHDALEKAKAKNTNGAAVDSHKVAELQKIVDEGGNLYLVDNGSSGYAVDNGNLTGVFKDPDNETPLMGSKIALASTKNGAYKGDCFGRKLVNIYSRGGYEPVARMKYAKGFNDAMDKQVEEQLQKGLIKEAPDVYVLKLRDGFDYNKAVSDFNNAKQYTQAELDSLPLYEDYDEMLKYRDSLIDMNLQYFAKKQPSEQGAFFDGVGKERGQSIHMRGEGKMQMEGVADEVAAEFKDQPDMYKVLKNADTKAKAEQIYNTAEDPLIEFRDMLRQKDPAALPLGHQLAKDYSAEGNYEAAAQIYREMGEELTKAGQFSQAAAINMMKNDPLTALEYAKREINNLNQAGAKRFGDKWKDFELTDDEVKAFNNIKPGDEEAIKNLFDQIGERIGKDYPTTFMDKLLEGRKVAMLFNVRTNVRNVLANVPTLGMRWTADRVEAVGQNIAHLINPEIEVTQAIRGSGKEGRRLATQAFESKRVQSLLEDTPGKYEIPELRNALTKNKQMYKGTKVEKWLDEVTGGGIQKVNEKLFGKKGVQSGLETIRNATYKMLDLGDKPFVKENFVERLGSYIRAKGIKNIDEIPDEAIQMAWDEAMKATYKDNSWAVQMLGGIKKGVEKVPGVGRPISQAAIPFLQAPGNIAARMVDYSPVKAAKGIGDIISGASKNDAKAVTKGIEEAAKGLTGSGLILLGIGLRNSGLITGTYSDDKDQKAFEKQNGFKEFALHIGDKYFTYDWAQPFSEELILGTLLADAINKSDQYDSDILRYFGYENTKAGHVIGGLKEGTKGAVNSWFNSSPLQGLADLMKGSYNNQSDVAQNLWDTGVSDFASAFVPSAVNAVAKSIDPVRRNTYNPNNSFGSFVDSNVAKLPGLSKTLPAKYDTWGREMKYADNTKLFGMPVDEHVMSTASRFLVPGEYSYDRNDPVDKEINRLFESTNDNGVFPLVANNSVGDTKLNNRQVSEYQKDMGERSRAFTEAFVNSEAYKSMEDDSKVDTLKKLYGVSKAITERDVFGKEISDNNTYKKAIEIYDKAGKGEEGVKALMNYYTAKSISDQAGISANSNAAKAIQEKIESGDTEEANSMAEQVEKLPTLGLDSPAAKGAYTKAYGVYGKGYSAEEFSKTFKAIDKDGNQALKKDDEVIPYMNSQHMNYSDGMKFWKAFAKTEGSKPWKIPSLKDGTWK